MAIKLFPPQWRERLLADCNAHGWTTGVFGHQQMRLLTAWSQSEGGTAKYNPLNTTYPLPWGSSDYNSVGVKNYAQAGGGSAATYLTLATTHNSAGGLTYGSILGWLQAGTTTAEECVRSFAPQFQIWGTDTTLLLSVLAETP